MAPMCGKQRVVRGTIGGIREGGAEAGWPVRRSRSEVPAPGVSQLRTRAGCQSKRNLAWQRMIVGVPQVCFHDGVGDLRIRLNEIFCELLAVAENRSRKTGKQAALRVRLVTGRTAG